MLQGEQLVATSHLVAPNDDTSWSVVVDSDTVNASMIGPDLYAAYAGPIAFPDFNFDRRVDGNDFLVWQAGFGGFPGGGATRLDGDADRNGHVDGDDFLIWQNQFGKEEGGGSAAAATKQARGRSTALNRIRDLLFAEIEQRFRQHSAFDSMDSLAQILTH